LKIRVFIAIPAGLLFLLLSTSIAFASPSAGIPLDSWIYPALDKLAGFGLIDSALQGDRPFSRIEAARLTAEGLAKAEAIQPPPVVGEILRRLESELRESLEEVRGGTNGGYFKPVREFRLDAVFQDGDPSVIAGKRFGSGADLIDARQFALNTNNYGIEYEEDVTGQAILETEARLGRYLLINWRPLVLFDGEGASLTTLQGTAALGLGPVEISVGRQSLWWGQGRHGSLILTNNAKPLDMVRITNPTPVLLPWVLKYLGPFRFDAFWSKLEEDRVVPEPYFSGLRLSFKPLPWFEFGGSRTVMFGGQGRPDVGWDDFITILGGKNLSGDEDNSNNVAALDARIRIPFLWNAEVYGEWGREDEAGGFIANKSWLAGLYLPQLEPSSRLSLRAEYADLSHIDDNSPVWYRHGIYRSGYTYEGNILGHHAGGGAKDYYLALTAWLPAGALTLECDYEERGYDQPIREKHLQPGMEALWDLNDTISLELKYALDQVENFGYEEGEDRTFHFGMLGVKGVW